MAWEAMNLLLGVPAVVLAGISGAIALNAGSPTLVGILALISSALGALLNFLNPARRAVNSTSKAQACWAVAMRARLYLAADLPKANIEEARGLLVEIQTLETEALNALAATP